MHEVTSIYMFTGVFYDYHLDILYIRKETGIVRLTWQLCLLGVPAVSLGWAHLHQNSLPGKRKDISPPLFNLHWLLTDMKACS